LGAIEQVKPALNGLFRTEDIRNLERSVEKFELRLEILPIPTGNDFRVALLEEQKQRISGQIDRTVREALARGTEDLWLRLRKVVARLTKARTALLLDHPFFGSLLFRLKIECHAGVATMATDGTTIFYNPGFVDTLSTAELVGVLAHEVMHPALQHHTRRGDREARRWNMAADDAINPLLVDAGLTLPADALRDDRFRNMSAERIYNLLAETRAAAAAAIKERATPRPRIAPAQSTIFLRRIGPGFGRRIVLALSVKSVGPMDR
jgi:hypothetical protein